MVRVEGLEPTHLAALEPKSSASTNSATLAQVAENYSRFVPKTPTRTPPRPKPTPATYNPPATFTRPNVVPVEHYENFPVASILLPPKLRRPIEAIYAFARSADDFADEGDLAAIDRLGKLEAYARELDALEAGARSESPLFAELASMVNQYQLPVQLLRDLLDAFKQDVVQDRYADFAELLDYCRRSANPIGRLLLQLLSVHDPSKLRLSDDICTALQLINHWQDVAIDWRKNAHGRVYLPQDEMRRFGVSDADIGRGIPTPEWRALMAFQVGRARTMMNNGAPLAKMLSGRFSIELRLIVAGGLTILDKIDAVDGDVFNHRPTVSRLDWLGMLCRVLPDALLKRP
jgi:squalene synthase HpnC